MNNMQLLKTLSESFGPSGFEDDVRDKIRKLVTPLVDDVRTDPLGNLIATINPGKAFTLLLDAHMDEIGFMVSHVEEKGFLRFSPIGGWDERLLPALRVSVKTSDQTPQLRRHRRRGHSHHRRRRTDRGYLDPLPVYPLAEHHHES